jgi:hypothetical protein
MGSEFYFKLAASAVWPGFESTSKSLEKAAQLWGTSLKKHFTTTERHSQNRKLFIP